MTNYRRDVFKAPQPPAKRLFNALHAALILVCLLFSVTHTAHAREVGVAFIEDAAVESSPRLAERVVQELTPLLGSGVSLVPKFYAPTGGNVNPTVLFNQAVTDTEVDFIVVTGRVASQALYELSSFGKPTYLLRLTNPEISGANLREATRNLRTYTTANTLGPVFQRLQTLFQPQRIGVLTPPALSDVSESIGDAVRNTGAELGMEVIFAPLNPAQPIDEQIPDIDVAILPPYLGDPTFVEALLQTLLRRGIPSYAVGGDEFVQQGALMSDTLSQDLRVLARRVALDLDDAMTRGQRTTGMQLIEPRQVTSINIDTARTLNVDFSLDELTAARIIQGSNTNLDLTLDTVIALALERNLTLGNQELQLAIDQEGLAQARATRRPQLSAQIDLTRRSPVLPEMDTVGAIALNQLIYSVTANAQVKVATLSVDASRSALKQAELDTIQQVASAYFGALNTQAQFESSLRTLTLNRDNLALAEQRNRSGSGSGAEIYRWQAIIASSETAVLNAYTANSEAQSRLAQLLNTRLQIPERLADIDLNDAPFDLLNESLTPLLNSSGQADALREATASRAIEQSAQQEINSTTVSINETLSDATRRSLFTPELSLGAQYGYNFDSTENAMGIEPDGEDQWQIALTARLPLWSGGSQRSLIRQYDAQTAQARNQLSATETALWANSTNVINRMITNYRAIELSLQAQEAALRSQQITQNAYRLGSTTISELLDTQNEYQQAQDNADLARYQYLAAVVDFQALTGEMPMLWSGVEQKQWLDSFQKLLMTREEP